MFHDAVFVVRHFVKQHLIPDGVVVLVRERGREGRGDEGEGEGEGEEEG